MKARKVKEGMVVRLESPTWFGGVRAVHDVIKKPWAKLGGDQTFRVVIARGDGALLLQLEGDLPMWAWVDAKDVIEPDTFLF